jgi:hypothetical protein
MAIEVKTKTGGVTVTVTTEALLTIPLLEAVILAVPAETAVTKPAALTVATAGLLETQVKVGCVTNAAPFWSSAEAANCWVTPPTVKAEVVGVTAIEVKTKAGGVTVTVTTEALLTIPLLEAVMLAVPADIGITRPAALTIATAGLLEAQVNAGCVAKAAPFWSSAEAVNC